MGEQIPFPGGQQPPPTQIKIDVSDLTDVVCDECEGKFFRSVTLFKRLSPLMSPTGKEQIVPIPSFRCDDCGHVNEQFLPKLQEKES